MGPACCIVVQRGRPVLNRWLVNGTRILETHKRPGRVGSDTTSLIVTHMCPHGESKGCLVWGSRIFQLKYVLHGGSFLFDRAFINLRYPPKTPNDNYSGREELIHMVQQ